MRQVCPSALGLVCCSLLACTPEPAADTGSESGSSESGAETSDEETGRCGVITRSVIADPLTIPPGFDSTVTAMIAIAEGTYAGELVWADVEAPFEVVHAGTQSPITVSLGYAGGEIRLTEVELAGEFPDGVLGAPCANTVEVDVSLSITTEDGLFAESMTVPLEISGFPGQGTGQPNVYHVIDFAAHAGSLALEDFGATQGSVSDVLFGVTLTQMEAAGWVGMEIADGSDVTFGMVATFTAAAS